MTRLIGFTDHANQRMIERNVLQREVLETINAPQSYSKSRDSKYGLVWKLERKTSVQDHLRVVADIIKADRHNPQAKVSVLTVYWLNHKDGIRPKAKA